MTFTSSGAGSGPILPVNKGTLWHHRLGHPGVHIMRKLKLPMTNKVCRGCKYGKHKRSPFNGTMTRPKTPLDRLHFDLNSPPIPTVGDEKYALVVIDDYSRFTWIFFLKAKSESTAKLIEFVNFIKKQTNERVRQLHFNRGGEFVNHNLKKFISKKGILHELTAADSPQSNSVAERFNLTLFDTICSMEHSYGILKQLWLAAASVYLRNRLPHKSNNNTSPYERFNGKEPSLTHLCMTWADAFVHLVKRKQVSELAPCTTRLKLIGYKFDGAYRSSALKLAKDYIPPEELYKVQEILDSRDSPEGPEFLCKWLALEDGDNTWEPLESVNHLTKQVLSSDDAPKWTEAINVELQSLHTHDTWEVIDPKTLPHNQRPICTKWVFKIKRDLDGQPQRYKARLVVKGFEQRYGIDYNKTYAPVATIATQRVLLALAASLALKCHQMDVVTAFLNGIVTEMILIYAPEGSGFPPGTILRLRKALYSLKQAPRGWYSLLHKELTFLGFTCLANDNAVYIRTLPESDSSQYISVYVDDLLIFAKTELEILSNKASLHNEFNITDLGKSYVNDILERVGLQDCKPVNTPMDQTKLEPYEVENTKTSPNPQEGEYREIVGSLIDHVDKEIHLEYLLTAEMVADSLTKPLPAPAFKYHRDNMCMKHYDNIVIPMTQASMTELRNE
ncbi:DNA-directed DNA polymerase [Powellomyces hirtus]|uniref:DNA-directed DNA polymerase n=1 Tax=Powellomyces hirtus TaxID=109895 RepID=A0A507DNC1_9FUNG|nr:DNA-directed DNA polymerase [Powellomyces hirtus]